MIKIYRVSFKRFFSSLAGEEGPRLACLGHGFKGSRIQGFVF
jgi:hypothetical protein